MTIQTIEDQEDKVSLGTKIFCIIGCSIGILLLIAGAALPGPSAQVPIEDREIAKLRLSVQNQQDIIDQLQGNTLGLLGQLYKEEER